MLGGPADGAGGVVGQARGQLGRHLVEPALLEGDELGEPGGQLVARREQLRVERGGTGAVGVDLVEQCEPPFVPGHGGDEVVDARAVDGEPGHLLGRDLQRVAGRRQLGGERVASALEVGPAGGTLLQGGREVAGRGGVALDGRGGGVERGGAFGEHPCGDVVEVDVVSPDPAPEPVDDLGPLGGLAVQPLERREVAADPGRALGGVEGRAAPGVGLGVRVELGEPLAGPLAPPAVRGGVAGRREHPLGAGLDALGRVEGREGGREAVGEGRGDLGEPCRECVDGGLGQGRPAVLVGRGGERAEGVVEAHEVVLERLAGGVECGGTVATGVGEPLLDVGVDADVEEPLEDLAAVLRRGSQEGGEVALGQEDDRRELRHPHPEDVLDDVRDLVVAGAQGLPPAAAELLEHDGGLDPGGAAAALLGPVPLG